MKKLFLKIRDAAINNRAVFIAAAVCFSLAFTALHVHVLCMIFPRFADLVNIYVAGGVRFVLAKITGILPFSLGETAALLLPVYVVLMFVFVGIEMHRDNYARIRRFYALSFAILSLFYTTFVFTLGMGYHGTKLDEKLGLETKDLTSDELLEVSKWLGEKVNEYAAQVECIDDGPTVMPYDFKGMNDALCRAYKKAAEKYPFVMGYSSRIKPVMCSRLMTKAGMLGMYSYYSGESNVNIDYMDYNLVFTCAHEMSHQRGIARENEANFMAFLVCLESEDPYIVYSGYLNIFEYMLNPLYEALETDGNLSAYNSLLRSLDRRARADIGLSNQKARDNEGTISNISNKINDTFIKINQDPHGTKSYGLVIELAAAYYFDIKESAK